MTTQEIAQYAARGERWYPQCCMSINCGDVEPTCRTCPCREIKDSFTDWKKRTNAYQPDPIWAGGLWKERIAQ